MAKAKKEKKPPEPYWNDLVSVYFEFCRTKFTEAPSFDGSAPRDMKAIIESLRKRAEIKNIEWTQELALSRFKTFLEYAFSDWWLSENWLLSNINRQKDRFFFKISQNRGNK